MKHVNQKTKLKSALFLISLVTLTLVGSFTYMHIAYASFGRADNLGYFSGVGAYPPDGCDYSQRGANNCKHADDSANVVLPSAAVPADCPSNPNKWALPDGCVSSVAGLVNLLKKYNASGDERLHASSAFIFHSIIGETGPQADANGGRNITNGTKVPGVPTTGWTGFTDLLNDELANGQIHIGWDVNFTASDRTYAEYVAPWSKTQGNTADVAHYADPGDPQHDTAIVIYNSKNQVLYALFRPCANPDGTFAGLPTYVQTKKWTLTGSATVTPATVVAGTATTVKYTVKVHNNGPDTASYPEHVDYFYPNSATFKSTVQSGTQTTTSGGTYTYTDTRVIPAGALGGDQYCQNVTYGNATGPGTGSAASSKACVTVLPPACSGTISGIPNPWQAGDASPVTFSFPASASTQTLTYAIAGPSGFTSSGGPFSIGAGGTTYTVGSVTLPAAGTYHFTWSPTGSSSSCKEDVDVVSLPYFSVFGADVRAGGDFLPACRTGSGGTGGVIGSWYNNQTATAGASTLFSAIALDQVTGFGSNHTRNAPPNTEPTGLSFANAGLGAGNISTSTTLPELGGKFGGQHCFYSPTQPGGTLNDVTNPSDIGTAPLINGPHGYTGLGGNLTLNGGPVGTGKNLALYVNGDVYITPGTSGGIVYSGAGWAMKPNGTSTIPSFTLVVTGGNIYIDPGVTELDGTYVAEQDTSTGNGGTIYTCGYDTGGGNFAPVAPVDLYNTCNNQLQVYGSFVADQIDLMRTFGTLHNANKTETPNSAARVCENSSVASPVCGAEMYDMGPEMFLSSPAVLPPNSGAPFYNAITSLPPVL